MAESVTNKRTIQRWEGDWALTHAGKVHHDDGVIELHDDTGTYQMRVHDFNDLIVSQTRERLAEGHKEPLIVAIPESVLRKVS